jgi:hypothetical protein
MNSVKLYFGTTGYVNLSVSSRQNNYTPAFSLPITMEEDGATTYIINVFGAENSVYPVFKTSETSYFKFEHNNINSQCIKVQKNQCISSFISNDVVYGLEVLNKKRQNEFEKSGGHKCKDLAVWFAVDSPVSSNIFSSQSYDECDDTHNFSFGDFEEERDSRDGGRQAAIESPRDSRDGGRQAAIESPRDSRDGGRQAAIESPRDSRDGGRQAAIESPRDSRDGGRQAAIESPRYRNSRNGHAAEKAPRNSRYGHAAMESVKATVALNNTSTDKYQTEHFVEPKVMNKRTFRFCFKNKPTMLGNLYL